MLTPSRLAAKLEAQGGKLGHIGRQIAELPPAEVEILSSILEESAHTTGHVAHEVQQDEEGFDL